MKIDLHCHSSASDGRRTPAELYGFARERSLTVFSLTDHDTTAGLKAILELDRLCEDPAKPRFIPGIELSSVFGHENIHLLGYFQRTEFLNEEFEKQLLNFRQKRDSRGLEMISRLKLYYDIEIDIAQLDLDDDASLGRPHLAKLIQEKYSLPFDEVFRRYLGKHSKAYLPSSKIPTAEGIQLLKTMGALVVMAHPGEYKLHIAELSGLPFDGVECYYPKHTAAMTEKYIAYAHAHNLLITCGSDDHGIPGDEKHGLLGDVPFDPAELWPFLKTMGINPVDLPAR